MTLVRPPCWLFLFLFVKGVCLLENGLARTPPMGWMSWGYYMCADNCDKTSDKCLNEELIMSVADAFYTQGYQEAGYEYIIIDDCWSERERVKGRLVPDKKRFPRGMKFLADYIHSRGLKFGMYGNIAETTCMQFPGSRYHFRTDSMSLAEWEVDYIKVDGCFVKEDYLDVAYIMLGEYLNKTGRPMVYSCSWPYYKKYIHKHEPNYTEIMPVCNLWRNFHDVAIHWGNVRYILKHYEENAHEYRKYHGPGHWNDPDMLILGTNSLTPGQSRIQFSIWAMLSAPLLLSCDMKRISDYEKKLLLNMNLIAVAQDPKGVMAIPYKLAEEVTLWVKPHHPWKGDQFSSYSFAIVNLNSVSKAASFLPRKYMDTFYMDSYTVLDMFTDRFIRNITLQDKIDVIVPSEGESIVLQGDKELPSFIQNPERVSFTEHIY